VTRYLLLSISIIGLLVWILFRYSTDTIDRLDNKIVSFYVDFYRTELAEARNQIKEIKSVDLLEQLLGKLSAIQRNDRLSGIKRQSLDLITETYLKRSENEKAVHWAEIWTEFDERDLPGAVRLYTAMYEIPERRAQAIESLNKLRIIVPESEMAARRSVQWAMEDGRLLDAFQICRTYVERTYSTFDRHWTVFWDTGSGFKGSQSQPIYPTVTGQRDAQFEVELPKGIVSLRLDPPPLARYFIQKPLLKWRELKWKDSASRVIALQDLKLRLHDMERKSGWLETTGGSDPYFSWQMPESFALKSRVIRFEARLDNPLPGWVREVVNGRESDQIELLVDQSGDQDLFTFYSLLQEQLTEKGLMLFREQLTEQRLMPLSKLAQAETIKIAVYWTLDQKHFSEKRTADKVVNISGARRFETAYSINSVVRRLRLDFPDSDDAKITIDQLQLVDTDATVPVDMLDANYVLMHNVSRVGSTFSLHGNDPHFAIQIDDRNIDQVLVQGKIQ